MVILSNAGQARVLSPTAQKLVDRPYASALRSGASPSRRRQTWSEAASPAALAHARVRSSPTESSISPTGPSESALPNATVLSDSNLRIESALPQKIVDRPCVHAEQMA